MTRCIFTDTEHIIGEFDMDEPPRKGDTVFIGDLHYGVDDVMFNLNLGDDDFGNVTLTCRYFI